MRKVIFLRFVFLLGFVYMPFIVLAKEDKEFLLRLEGEWKFSIGDNDEWAMPDFDDSNWDNIKVPSAWEDQGYYGYDGCAWYRTSFSMSKEMKNRELYLNLGYIDDVDQVFINGKLIGFSGSFPPQFSTAFEARRRYPIPDEYLNATGKNIIAVRVYNHQMAGGILSGDIGISAGSFKPDLSIFGLWLFRTGDNKLWNEVAYKDKQWKKIVVPGNWENQGYSNYNGFAWYRKHFRISEEYTNQKLVLVIGKIFNIDEVYINGQLIGSSGKMPVLNEKHKVGEEEVSKKCRVYTVPDNLILSHTENVIAVRIFNLQLKGGITDGPVGFVKLANYNRYFKEIIEGEN